MAVLVHLSSRCAQHHRETRPCISLPVSISFIANIAQKRPELNRDKTSSCWPVGRVVFCYAVPGQSKNCANAKSCQIWNMDGGQPGPIATLGGAVP